MVDHYTVDMENPKSWDEYFYNLSKVVASNSKCLSRKIGAVIALGHTIISTGYNGPSRGVRRCDKRWLIDEKLVNKYNEKATNKIKIVGRNHDKTIITDLDFGYKEKTTRWKNEFEGKCPRYIPEMGFKSGEGLDWCVAGHAERNAIINVARHGLYALKGTTLYVTCDKICTPCLVEIKNAGIEEIVCPQEDIFYDISGEYQLRESGIKIRTYDFMKE